MLTLLIIVCIIRRLYDVSIDSEFEKKNYFMQYEISCKTLKIVGRYEKLFNIACLLIHNLYELYVLYMCLVRTYF